MFESSPVDAVAVGRGLSREHLCASEAHHTAALQAHAGGQADASSCDGLKAPGDRQKT